MSDGGRRHLVGQDKAGGIRECSCDQVEAGKSHYSVTKSAEPINHHFLDHVGVRLRCWSKFL